MPANAKKPARNRMTAADMTVLLVQAQDRGLPALLKPRPVLAADRKPLQQRLGLVDLGAMHGHDHAGPRTPARKRQRNEDRPVGGVNHVVSHIEFELTGGNVSRILGSNTCLLTRGPFRVCGTSC